MDIQRTKPWVLMLVPMILLALVLVLVLVSTLVLVLALLLVLVLLALTWLSAPVPFYVIHAGAFSSFSY